MKAACNHLSNPVFIASFVLSLGTYMPSFVEICHNWFVSHNSNTFYLSKNIFKVYMYLWYGSHKLKCHLSYNLPDHLWDTVKAYELVKWVIKYWVTTSSTSHLVPGPDTFCCFWSIFSLSVTCSVQDSWSWRGRFNII